MRRWLGAMAWLALAAAAVGDSKAEGPSAQRFLTGPSDRSAVEIARDFVPSGRARARAAGSAAVAPTRVEPYRVEAEYRSPNNGCSHVVLRQQIAGLDVWNGDLAVNVDPRGRVINVHDRFARTGGEPSTVPLLSAVEAIEAAALALGSELEDVPRLVEQMPGPAREARYSGAGIARGSIPARLAFHREPEGAATLVWNLQIRERDRPHWWNLNVDAATGELRTRIDWVRHDSYNVFPRPVISPDVAPRALVSDVADILASPEGWHDTDGIPGPEFLDTRGNNVEAQEDVDFDDQGGARPSGGPSLVFDFPLDLEQPPEAYVEASVANLFYWGNVLHDIHYEYGFDEAAGNFQTNNLGQSGFAQDPVQADAQDGGRLNNALFIAPPDGLPGRMEFFLWSDREANLGVVEPAGIAGDVFALDANFGPALGQTAPVALVVQALDAQEPGAGHTTTDACSTLANPEAIEGRIALVDRGVCFFKQKVRNAQEAGAIGVIVANNGGEHVPMGDVDEVPEPIDIPSLHIDTDEGAALKAQLASGVMARLVRFSPATVRDSGLDSGTVIHEYGHGVSLRLTGGPATTSCLFDNQGFAMGEGWSDFWALALTAQPGDTPTDPRPFGAYLNAEPPDGEGIRNYPYSFDMQTSPLTYGQLDELNAPHGQGEIWAAALWDLFWLLVAEHGFDEDVYRGSGGNNRALQLVMDGLKLQPCEPTYLDGRDAILAADLAATGGEDECAIWRAFARRGMGASAGDGGGPGALVVDEAFDVPVQCVPEPSAAALQLAALAALGALARGRWAARRR